MAIVALKMRFRQNFSHLWKALGLSFLKQQGIFAENVVVLSYGQPIRVALFRTYIRIPATKG